MWRVATRPTGGRTWSSTHRLARRRSTCWSWSGCPTCSRSTGDEVGGVDLGAALLVLRDQSRPVGADAPAVLVVPVVAGRPHAVLEAVLHLGVVALLGLGAYGDRPSALGVRVPEQGRDRPGRGLEHVDDRAAT